MAFQRVALLQHTLGENRSEPRRSLLREHGRAIDVEPPSELCDQRAEVARAPERRVGAVPSLDFPPLPQPAVADTLPCAQCGSLLSQPFEVDRGIAVRTRGISDLGEPPSLFARCGATEPRLERTDPTTQSTDGDAESGARRDQFSSRRTCMRGACRRSRASWSAIPLSHRCAISIASGIDDDRE